MVFTRIRQLLIPKAVANNGSQLRDHQANERTFLSWTRMGLAFGALSLALSRLGMIDREAGNSERTSQSIDQERVLASRVCQGLSAWSFAYGFFRYMSVRQKLLRGSFVPALWGPALMTGGSIGSLFIMLQKDFE
ncbi:hypothetical protein MW887_003402 [Aspergillus wentii]|nr:hypothetical protein MW887_003402 [Aspergillus wentii]